MTSTETAPQIGRPREFDDDAVLDAVVDLFWEKGFGATSVGDIVARTGLSKSSLYGAFGSKDALFETALDRYLADHRLMIEDQLVGGTRGLDDIDTFLSRVEQRAGLSEPRGCLAVNTATERRSAEPAIVELGTRHRDVMRRGFAAALARAVERGEIEPHRVTDLANLLVATTLGLAVMVSGGASADEVGSHLESISNSLRQA